MNIRQAFNQLTAKEFVNWALKNKYSYFIAIEGNREHGWIWAKGSYPKQYKFDYKTN
jgi:hypothetical protein